MDVSVEGDVVQHMLVTANMSKGEDVKEIESANKECMMVTTVWGNLEGYTRHEIETAQEARTSRDDWERQLPCHCARCS